LLPLDLLLLFVSPRSAIRLRCFPVPVLFFGAVSICFGGVVAPFPATATPLHLCFCVFVYEEELPQQLCRDAILSWRLASRPAS